MADIEEAAEQILAEFNRPWTHENKRRILIEAIAKAVQDRPSLFQLGDFTLHSGARSRWKIEADALTEADWQALAYMAAERLPAFGSVEGVPRGGIPFAKALRQYAMEGPLLIAEDVTTTGASMERVRADREAIGVVVFARGPVLAWVTPLFTLTQRK